MSSEAPGRESEQAKAGEASQASVESRTDVGPREAALVPLQLALRAARLRRIVLQEVAQEDIRIDSDHARPAARRRMTGFIASTDKGFMPFR